MADSSTMFLFALAVIPGVLLIWHVHKNDRLESEPAGLLIKLFIMGALCCIPAALLEVFGESLAADIENETLNTVITTFIVVGVAEEGCKYIVLKLGSWKNRAFNCRYDGIVYAVYVSMGFAILENLFYVFGNADSISVGIARAFTSLPGHCFFGILMGRGYGLAKQAQVRGNLAGAAHFRRTGLLYAVLAHGLYDCLAFLNSGLSILLFAVLVTALYIAGIKIIRQSSENDGYFIPPVIAPELFANRRRFCTECGAENYGRYCTNCGCRITE